MPSFQILRNSRHAYQRPTSTALSFAAALVLAGCASTASQSLPPSASGELKGRTIVRTERSELPTFKANTPGKAGFGLLGMAAMNKAGNALINDNKVADPALAISSALSDELQRRYQTRAVSARLPLDTDKLASIAKEAQGKADYVLDVRTVDWSSAYFATDWGKYYVNYSAESQLIDVARQAVVARASCQYSPSDGPEGKPSYEELTGNGAALLKTTLGKISTLCAKEMAAAMFASTAKR